MSDCGRPRRRLVWRIARACLLIVAALVLLYGLGIVYFLVGRPEPSVDYLAQVNARAAAVAEADRAWPAYRAILLELPDPPVERAADFPRPGDAGWSELETWLRDNADALAAVRDAAAEPGLGFLAAHRHADADRPLFGDSDLERSWPLDDTMIGVLLPHLGELRRLASLLAADAQRAALDGDSDAVVKNVEAMLGMAAHLREIPFLINDLVGSAAARKAVDVVGPTLAADPAMFDDTQLRRLVRRLDAADELFYIRFEGERLGWLDIVQRIYTDNGDGDGRITPRAIRSLAAIQGPDADVTPPALMYVAGPLLVVTVMSRREAVELHEEMISEFETNGRRPMWQWTSSPGADAESMMGSWRGSLHQTVRHMPLLLLMPAISTAATMGQLGELERDGVLVALALELDHRQRGAWAAGVEDLVPALLPAAPPDRFDGQPLRFTIVDDRPVVYSIGNDRKDDGGRIPPGNELLDAAGANEQAGRWTTPPRPRHTAPAVVDGDWILWPKP